MKKQHQRKLNIYQVIEQSSSVYDRLKGNFIPEADRDAEKIIQTNLESWCQKIAKGDWQLFKKRLEWDSIALEEVQHFLGAVRLKDRQNLPDWAKILEEVV
ncbi:MAG TPA: hypothetical protein V6C91_11015, partial [Coleofasciculaceae cyanobacterium]